MPLPFIIVVGGFLGAGKTSLLRTAAGRLRSRGHQVGLVTNDQAPDLVDTSLLTSASLPVREVAGSCFCCNFPAFERSLSELVAQAGEQADASSLTLLAEPVGSCTDLAATIIRPLRRMYADRFGVGPLSVLIDPERLSSEVSGRGGLDPDARYIMRKQLEEADEVIVTKADLLDSAARARTKRLAEEIAPGRVVRVLSAHTGEGVDEWLESCLAGSVSSGERSIDVDYDRYARGEAVLGWMNTSIRLRRAEDSPTWNVVMRDLLAALREECAGRALEIGHVKAWMEFDFGWVAGNVTSAQAPTSIRAEGGIADRAARLIVNARVQTSPENLSRMVGRAVASMGGLAIEHEVVASHALSPGRPVPTHRLSAV